MSNDARMTKEVDVYDFDKTIYQGDCSIDFYLFCIRKKPKLLASFPFQLWHLWLFIAKLEDRTTFKSHFFTFLRGLGNTGKYVDDFWGSHYKNIKEWYKKLDHSQDIIISASPEFLLKPILPKLQVHELVATRMDAKTGVISGQNCRGQEKVVRLKQVLNGRAVRRVYTDSLADMPILALAQEKYIVKGNQIIKWQDYAKKRRIKKLSLTDLIE